MNLTFKRDTTSKRNAAIRWMEKYFPEIIDMRCAGMSYRDIADVFNGKGICTRQGNPWTGGTVSNVLKNAVKYGMFLKEGA